MRPPALVELTELTDASEEQTVSICGLEYSSRLKRETAHSYQRVILQKTVKSSYLTSVGIEEGSKANTKSW
jgi:hypothetical protein